MRPAPAEAAGVARLLAVVLAAAVAGVLALVAAASMSSRPARFLPAGLVVFMVVLGAGIGLVTRNRPARHRWQVRLAGFAAGALAGIVAFAVTPLAPLGDPRLAPARGRPRPTPVVVVHGGPGVADMAGDAAYFGQLAGDGYDVWVYEQVGTGRSSRLADPRRYDIAREVADLEAIRGRIGADRMVLIGHPYADITGGQVTFSNPGWATVNGPGGRIDFQTVPGYTPPTWPEPTAPNHLHLDFYVDDLAATQARVLAAGATRYEFQPNADHCLVFADPAGHPFCLTTWDDVPT